MEECDGLEALKKKEKNLKRESSLEVLKQNWRTLSTIKKLKPRLILTEKNVTV